RRYGCLVGSDFEIVVHGIETGQSGTIRIRVRLEHDVPTAEEVVVRNVYVKQGPVANHAVMSWLVTAMSWMRAPPSSTYWSAMTTSRPGKMTKGLSFVPRNPQRWLPS